MASRSSSSTCERSPRGLERSSSTKISGEVVRIEGSELDLTSDPQPPYRDCMFAVYCPRHRARVLLGHGAIQSVTNTAGGVVVQWECHCGAVGTMRTGRRPARARDIVDERRGA